MDRLKLDFFFSKIAGVSTTLYAGELVPLSTAKYCTKIRNRPEYKLHEFNSRFSCSTAFRFSFSEPKRYVEICGITQVVFNDVD